MQGKIKVNEHTSDVIVQLNGCDNLLESGSHEADIQSPLITLKLEIAKKGKVVFRRWVLDGVAHISQRRQGSGYR